MWHFSAFLKLRTMAFAIIMLTSLVWTTLLSVWLFIKWDISDSSQREIVVVFIVANWLSAVILPTMLTVDFRAWVDAAPLLALLFLHVGTAIIYTLSFSQFSCPPQNTAASCRDINLVILCGSWVNPALREVPSFTCGRVLIIRGAFIVLAYVIYLGVVLIWRSQDPEAFESFEKRQSELPMMLPPQRVSANTFTSIHHDQSNGVDGSSQLPWLAPAMQPASRDNQDLESDDSSPRSSGRLSKPLPKYFY
ncbi:predicted protein [Sparassis crispa]|uniref:Uncharacterized protein n=1 Tax=Sparassis crispa TaxID=139825 RepID=A0A401GIP6_9APHY|nr:predicted protein [Sparassis crispa]GBE82028.1 predicted protein [Sparassis crispa]